MTTNNGTCYVKTYTAGREETKVNKIHRLHSQVRQTCTDMAEEQVIKAKQKPDILEIVQGIWGQSQQLGR